MTHLWSPSVNEPLPMLCFVSPPCEEVLLHHTCPLVFSLMPKGLTKIMLLIITMTNLLESTCVFARAMQRCSDQHCCLLVKGLIPTRTSWCGVCTFSLCIPVCFSRYPNHRPQFPDLHISLIGPKLFWFFFTFSLSTCPCDELVTSTGCNPAFHPSTAGIDSSTPTNPSAG